MSTHETITTTKKMKRPISAKGSQGPLELLSPAPSPCPQVTMALLPGIIVH